MTKITKNILITGCNGQLGNELRLAIEESNDPNTYYYTDVAELDITDKQAVENYFRDNHIQVVVNCAAYTNVDSAEDNPEITDQINHIAVLNLAKACAQNSAMLIHISTDYVFDGTDNTPYTESAPTHPLGVYGVTKLKGEEAVVRSGCQYIILRTSWLYSAFGKNFVKTMQRLTSEKETVTVVFDQAGTPTYAPDLANVILAFIKRADTERAIINQTYHFSNEGVCSWYDFSVAINEAFGHHCTVLPTHSYEYPSKVTRPSYSVLDKTKIKTTLGIQIPHWKSSMMKCVNRLKSTDPL